MSFFEPRLKPLPDAFYSEGDASPVRSKVLRRIPTWPGYVPYKLLELVDGESEATSICDQDPIIPLWPSTDDELETDVGQEKTETETWKADPKISMETQIQRKDEPAVKQEASSKVQVNLEAALADPPSTSFGPSLTMLPLEHRGQRSDHTLDECNSFRPPEKVPSFSCVSRGVLNGYVCPQYATQPHMLQPKQSEIKAANYEAFKKPVPQKSRNAHEKHGTPNGTPGSSKNVGLQQPAGTNAQKSVDPLEILENEQTVKAMKVGEAAKKKSEGNRKGEGDEGKGHGETHDAGRGPHAASACAPASACARGSSNLWKSQWTSRSEVVDSCKA